MKKAILFKEDHDAKQVVNDLRVGPGYFIWPDHSTARFDVIDCKLKRAMRLKIKGLNQPNVQEEHGSAFTKLKRKFLR